MYESMKRDVIPFGYHLLTYEFFKRTLQPLDEMLNDKRHLLSQSMAGGFAGD